MKIILRAFCLALLFVGITIQAGNYRGDKFFFEQPDGTKVEVKVYGNEFYQDVESIDGYTLIRDEQTRKICYALLSSDGTEYASSGIVYNGDSMPQAVKNIVRPRIRISKESIKKKIEEGKVRLGYEDPKKVILRTATVLPDTVYGVVVLLDFPDEKSSVTREQISRFCNGDNYHEFGNSCSVKEYYQWISGGKLTYMNYVTDFYTLPNDKSYYDHNQQEGDNKELEELLAFVEDQLSKEEYVRLSDLTQIEGKIVGVNIMYAGSVTSGWSCGLWPHMSNFVNLFFADEYYSNAYQISDIGESLIVGTFVHETAHLICGWPDFYSYEEGEDNNNIYGLGTQFISTYTHSPIVPSPLCLDWMGWLSNKIDITDINDGRWVSLHDRVGEAAVFYGTCNDASPRERYYLEVRNLNSEEMAYDINGIFIWHVNEDGNNTYTIEGMELEDCRPATYEDPCFKKGLKDEFNDGTDPSAVWFNGERSGLDIWNISEADTVMTFRCGSNADEIHFRELPQMLSFVKIPYSFLFRVKGGTAPIHFSIKSGDLPTGLTIDENGLLSGIPTTSGSYEFEVLATDNNGLTKTQTVSLPVLEAEPYNGIVSIPGVIEMEDYINGGESIGYHSVERDSSVSCYRKEDMLDIKCLSDTSITVSYSTDEWTRYVVDVTEEGNYLFVVNLEKNYYEGYNDFVLLMDEDTLMSYNHGMKNPNHRGNVYFEKVLSAGLHQIRFIEKSRGSIDNIMVRKINLNDSVSIPLEDYIVIPGTLDLGKFDLGGMNVAYGGIFGDCDLYSNRPEEKLCIGDDLLVTDSLWINYSVNVENTGWYKVYRLQFEKNVDFFLDGDSVKLINSEENYYYFLKEGKHKLKIQVRTENENYISTMLYFEYVKEFPYLEKVFLKRGMIGDFYLDSIIAFSPISKCTFSITDGDLPNGMNLTQDGKIEGAPLESGTFGFTVSVKDSLNEIISDVLYLEILDVTPYSDYFKVPGIIEAENFDRGNQDEAYSVMNLSQSAYRDEPVQIEELDSDGYQLVLHSNDWFLYSIDVKEAGDYLLYIDGYSSGSFDPFSFLAVSLDENPLGISSSCGISRPVALRLPKGKHKLKVLYLNIFEDSCMVDKMELKLPEESMPFIERSISVGDYIEIDCKDYDLGGLLSGYYDFDCENRGDFYREDGVDIYPDEVGSVGNVFAGEWLQYTVNIEKSGDYLVALLTKSESEMDSVCWELQLDGKCLKDMCSHIFLMDRHMKVFLPQGVHKLKILVNSISEEISGSLFLSKLFINWMGNSLPENETEPFSIYPNPSESEFTLQTDVPVDVRVFDVQGTEMLRFSSKGNAPIHFGESLHKDIYFMQVNQNSQSFFKKLIKQ